MDASEFQDGSSWEKFDYSLRPAKNMQRKMLCEAIARLSRLDALSRYRYIGFGAIGFHDFTIFHQRLGILDMTSIEGNSDPTKRFRIKKNKPYSCIEMKWGLSYDILPQLKWSKRTILWLDYEHPLDTRKLQDIEFASTSLRSGSALIVTVPADPGEPDPKGRHRFDELRENIGRQNLPVGLKASDLAESRWSVATVLRRIIVNQIIKSLADRSAVCEGLAKLRFDQIFHFHYADGKQMMTVGGLIVDGHDRSKLAQEHFHDLGFYRPDTDAYLIETPLLTLREIKLLDEKLPRSAPKVAQPAWIPESERIRYGKVYRYFPSYSEVET